ncbi:meiotic recombination protein DMC1, putative [Plasmodium knowlesi strain H]|uniref:Meiotic recombination protein DMC1, putative n=3 Tax=Plasmodium knowlesi TaxID=5850 RepID=A0A5K1VUP9_PLAKH|nr:meiotic recombination protein DMC1, putative [Plasmodium knowlesi strain H]OTN68146.1 putative Meiotic recombination protein DMC1 [Plasmodium knowlesi]CAA9986923.1 meiotic recombination protein DMC1, putative [Plasmodium knowlesi strain H]SBO26506.1 meiotic recombination protein DMC1, putative [Plasmodium knowlesi strain H]SBO28127.1 meiotic recombination protein DMC1, putative [Plasmodium knowlesi strain H]VVS76397.1 meiotic recombination protein DMC1, putative [Plasmodium knowlesi strain |eukprot:XP_002258170.1 Meiotic recombination protein DMC1-like protein,putative [Plasmodium knowlesi strain H]
MATLPSSKSTSKVAATTQMEEEVTKDHQFQEIEKLQDLGINAADINKLKGSGYCTILSLIQATKKELCNVKGISEAKVEKILEVASKIENCSSFITANQLAHKRSKVLKITTGSSSLDRTLGGGIESMSITELFGENRCGKTQICHTLAVSAQLPRSAGGGNGKVCYIDTEGTFRPEKICKIAERYGIDGEDVLDNILYARAFTHEHLYQLLAVSAAKMCEEPFALLVVDSIISLFRVDFSGRGELSERQQKLNKTLSVLSKLGEQFNIAVLITNQVMSDPGATMTFVANPMKPVGGHVIGHASTTRLSLRKGKGDQRVCKVYDAPNLPEVDCIFQLSEGGVIDATD